MSTLSMALTGLDTSNPVPGIYAEVRFAQGQTAGDLGPKRVLILAPKTSSGSITVDTQIVGPLSDEADFITYAGPGSPAHRMARAFLASCKSAEVYLLCPTAATGSAALDLITLTTTATGNGVLTISFAGEDIDVPITTGDTPTVIGDPDSAAARAYMSVARKAAAQLAVAAIRGAGAFPKISVEDDE